MAAPISRDKLTDRHTVSAGGPSPGSRFRSSLVSRGSGRRVLIRRQYSSGVADKCRHVSSDVPLGPGAGLGIFPPTRSGRALQDCREIGRPSLSCKRSNRNRTALFGKASDDFDDPVWGPVCQSPSLPTSPGHHTQPVEKQNTLVAVSPDDLSSVDIQQWFSYRMKGSRRPLPFD
ncbi:hypothetical protein LZ30DRAFT_690977 [Colletotrichum cereale]|nr:hypothetical protein LZ30DRAFT_690977 [Colletotrichum cereale]